MFLFDGPEDATATVLLAHGAGAPMDSGRMAAIAMALASERLRVARFEFEYMAGRRAGVRKPPPRAETLDHEYRAAVDALGAARPLVIAGKSMGGRVASMVADELFAAGRINGLVCLGYPFHPPAQPSRLRTAHLGDLRTPTLIVQGTRDPFGTRAEVSGYALSPAIDFVWIEDGDHDLTSRKKVTGRSAADDLKSVAVTVAGWIERLS